jgi:ceramide glucosyltransferase
MNWLAIAAATVACIGMILGMSGLLLVQRFRGLQRADGRAVAGSPSVTILKPLHGDEPLLEQALASFCNQDYRDFQIVFGVQDADDPAVGVVQRLRRRFPAHDISLVVDATLHGSNRKIGNLINMLPAARHDILVIADSDVHVAPDYLMRVVAALALPATGLVTTLYCGLPGRLGLIARVGAMHINHIFLPGALMARSLGRQDCLGATMALRRDTLAAIGGLEAIVNDLADDAMLGRLVSAEGLQVRLATTVPATTVPETRLLALFQHELRWARTIRSLVPLVHGLSAVQFPIFWSALAVILSGGEPWAWGLLGASWLLRTAVGHAIHQTLAFPTVGSMWLLPLRELMSVTVIVASFWVRDVQWRGEIMSAARPTFVPKGYSAAEQVLARVD